MKKSTFSVTDTAILAAFCMFLSIIEYLIPKPLPFMRIGLANVPIMISLLIFPISGTLLLSVLKILGQGLINGTLFSYIFLFSAAGSMASSIIMILVFNLLKKQVSFLGICIAGAMASNSVQILLARTIIFGRAAILIAPPFLLTGLIAAIILGIFTEKFTLRSEWVKSRREAKTLSSTKSTEPESSVAIELDEVQKSRTFYTRFVFICGILIIPGFAFQPNLFFKLFLTLFFIIISLVRGKKFKLIPNLLISAGIIAANLITPHGRVLAEIGSFRITAGALIVGIEKSALLVGLIYISRSSIVSGLSFPGKLGNLISMVFYYFERITGGERVKRKNLIEQLDQKLILLSENKDIEDEDSTKGINGKAGKADQAAVKVKPIKYVLAVIPVVIVWVLLAAGLLLRALIRAGL